MKYENEMKDLPGLVKTADMRTSISPGYRCFLLLFSCFRAPEIRKV